MVRLTAASGGARRPATPGPVYVELHCRSVFSLLDGASQPEALAARAQALGYPALALTDRDDLGGAVRFSQATASAGIGGIIGAEITIDVAADTRHHLVLLAEDRAGYGNLATLITRARLHAPRGEPAVPLDLLARHAGGLFALTGGPRGWVPSRLAAGDRVGARRAAETLHEIFDGRLALECWDHDLPEERRMVRALIPLARRLGAPWVVTNDVRYAEPGGRMVHDVLCALRHARPLDAMGTRLRPNGEWYLRSIAEQRHRWRHDESGLRATLAIAERCRFRLADLRPTLPAFPLPPGITADEYLERLAMDGAAERWGERWRARETHVRQVRHELAVIRRLGLAGYFLIVWDIVRFARREGILCQGRGSAANSAVCYCLGITAVDPVRMELLFERFLSEDRQEAPDIDIDFAHRERERVLQYVYERYGREHAAMVCEHITYRGRSAVRDAARVLGFSVQQADELSQLSDRFSARATAEALRGAGGEDGAARPLAAGLASHLVRGTEATTRANAVKHEARRLAADDHVERRNPTTAVRPAAGSVLASAGLDLADRRVRLLADIVEGLHQAPRHRSIHSGGFVLTAEPLCTVVPIEPASMPGRTVIQWEKDDLDAAGLVKIDLLGLGMLTVLQDCLKYVRATRGVSLDLATLDMDDQAVYDMLCRADTIGVFQVESRAQQVTLPRLRPRCFYDLVVEVALIRPGPIQGDMVHPYLRRRAGEEAVAYPHPSLEPILRRTLGVPLFQEQGMQVAIACAGFTPGEADRLRRAMGHKRSHERMAEICEQLVQGMQRNGIPEDTARRIYQQINAFADYGFPESHAASFALLVYASAYLKHYYTPEFTAALLNAQPMGFYAPGTLVKDARRHGARVRPVDLTRSAWDHTLEVDGELTVVPRDGVIEVRPAPSSRAPDAARAAAGETSAPAVRLGLRSIRGLAAAARARLEAALAEGPFTSVADVVHRTRLDARPLRLLAEAGAFDAMFPDVPREQRRRTALWHVLEARRGAAGPLAPLAARPGTPSLPRMSAFELTEADYRLTSLSLNGHPMRHLRATLAPNGVLTAREALRRADGDRVAVAGLVICRQRPGTAKGFAFLTLEDETGWLNIVVPPRRFEEDAHVISRSPLLLVRGTLQVEHRVVHLRGASFRALSAPVGAEHARSHDFR
ncbi:MAG TPA: DNA polymerase III subunit alpha [Gemmatimonadaceae bacterium]|nr:DNA polymerase III subunit alpha [Gemmatimonadaceae bacterium]